MYRFLAIFLVIFSSCGAAISQDTKAARENLATSIRDVLQFKNNTTQVRVSNCELEITTRVHNSCSQDTRPEWSRTIVLARELESANVRRSRHGYTINFELDFAGPNRVTTILNKLRYDENEAFEIYSEEYDRLLSEAIFETGKYLTSCTGETSASPSTSILVFTTAVPHLWEEIQKYLESCKP